MIILNKYKPVGDASKQPKTLPPRSSYTKPPCRFCREVRTIVKGAVEKVIGKKQQQRST